MPQTRGLQRHGRTGSGRVRQGAGTRGGWGCARPQDESLRSTLGLDVVQCRPVIGFLSQMSSDMAVTAVVHAAVTARRLVTDLPTYPGPRLGFQ